VKSLTLLATLLTTACCTTLPRLPVKRIAFQAPAARFNDVLESAGRFYDEKRDRDIEVRSYSPAGPRGRLPVVIVSHGIGEDRDSYAYLGRAIARHGFLVVHLTHAGTDRAVLERGYRHLYRATKDPQNWINRPLDVTFVLDQLALQPDFDVEHSAIVGHSAGAFTAFAAAGMKSPGGESLRDPRIKAIVPISMPRIPGNYDAVDIPVLNLTGTCDTSLIYRTFPRHRRIPFESTRAARQYLVTLQGVNHDMFSAKEDPHHPVIAAITVAFLRAYLQDDANARAWFEDAGRSDVLGVNVAVERH